MPRVLRALWEERRENPGHDLVSMLVHGEATSTCRRGPSRQPAPADRRRQRHDPQHHVGQRLCAQQVPDQYDKLIADPR